MRAGRLNDRVSLYGVRRGGNVPTWPLIGKAWAGFQEPKSAGRSEPTGIRAVESTFVRMRYRDDLVPGQLMERQGMWYLVESVEPGASRSELAISARRMIGQAAVYRPKGSLGDHSILAYLLRENVYAGPMNEPRYQIELFQPQLPSPMAQRGDSVILQGTTYKVDGVVEGSDDGVTISVLVTV